VTGIFCLLATGIQADETGAPAPVTPPAAPPVRRVDWNILEPWKKTVTAEEWREALTQRYAPHDAAAGLLEAGAYALYTRIQSNDSTHYYGLVNRDPAQPRPAVPPGARYWHTRSELPPALESQPLAGLCVALDPGHLGGNWADMEERSFSIKGEPPVHEGDLTLQVALLLKPRLEALGARVLMVRDRTEPVTTDTPNSLRLAATTAYLARFTDHPAPPMGDATREHDITKLAELLFYRTSEILARARRVNEMLRPDLVICIHFNGTDLPDPQNPTLVPQQHFHVMVNGAYAHTELENDDERLAMLERIADGAGEEELSVARVMAETAAPIFGLPAFTYNGTNAVALGANGYLWGRNLLANRVYRCPVVYFEPYVMNSVEGYARIQAGGYDGTREFGGHQRQNIFAEYAEAITAGLVKYYGDRPVQADAPASSPAIPNARPR
jgi:hypothetical protein